jgi:hypothetical protein
MRGNARTFTILDVDIPRADLLALYDGKPTEQALINAVKQERRALSIAVGSKEFLDFVESCRGGVGEDVQFYRLKPDCNGKAWKVIVKGNNRCAALRVVNDERERAGHPPFDLKVVQAERPGTGAAAGEYAEEQHALSNVRARMLPSQSAEVAAKFAARGMPAEGIRRYIDGCPPAEEIAALVILDGLCDEVKDACDAGRVKVAAVATLAGKSDDAQRAWLAKRTAPKPVKAPAPKRPTAKRVEAFADALLVHSGAKSAIFQAVGLLRGTLKIGDVTDAELRYAWQASEGARAGK